MESTSARTSSAVMSLMLPLPGPACRLPSPAGTWPIPTPIFGDRLPHFKQPLESRLQPAWRQSTGQGNQRRLQSKIPEKSRQSLDGTAFPDRARERDATQLSPGDRADDEIGLGS